MNLKMNIGYNKTTQKLIGYSNPKNGQAIVVEAYAVDDLQKKFAKELKKLQKDKDYLTNHLVAMTYLSDIDERETEMMIKSTEALLNNKG